MINRVCRLYGKGELKIEMEELEVLGDHDILVDMKRGGICGSDLHYYQDGGVGSIRVTEPIILGHEISGIVREVGASVTRFKRSNRVAINPSRPCMSCNYCNDKQHQHCPNIHFMGSARNVPHVQGGFRDVFIVDALQCHLIHDDIGFGEAACAEPLAVCLHAAKQAGELKGKRILVTGAGPIGSLCVAVASQAGAREIVVTDLSNFTLNIARQMGASHVINISKSIEALSQDIIQNGLFDVAFECSAAASAIKTTIDCTKPRGTIVQVGVGGDTVIPLNLLVGKEITFRGSHRFHSEFAEAVDHINNFRINVGPLITDTLPLGDAEYAINLAADRSRSMKVQLHLGNLL